MKYTTRLTNIFWWINIPEEGGTNSRPVSVAGNYICSRFKSQTHIHYYMQTQPTVRTTAPSVSNFMEKEAQC
jgi:hypothetical protein